MAITKGDVRLEGTFFVFDEAGEVVGLRLDVNFAYLEDGQEGVRKRKPVEVWDSLTSQQQQQANTVGKKLLVLAQANI